MAKILVVDDDPITLKIVDGVLRASGHKVFTAPDGYSAMDMLGKLQFDLVVTDVNMPGGFSGFQLATTIKQNKALSHILVILLTIRNSRMDVERAKKSGADHYFVKPIKPDSFKAKVTEILLKKTANPQRTSALVAHALWTTQLQVIDVSEKGLTIESPIPFAPEFELRFASNLFSKIGIATPLLKVSRAEPSSSTPGGYLVSLKFVALEPAEVECLRLWLIRRKASA